MYRTQQLCVETDEKTTPRPLRCIHFPLCGVNLIPIDLKKQKNMSRGRCYLTRPCTAVIAHVVATAHVFGSLKESYTSITQRYDIMMAYDREYYIKYEPRGILRKH